MAAAGSTLRSRRAFGQRGDEERGAPFIAQRARDLFEAQAIGVGLDDAGAFGRARGLVQLPPVGPERREIDREHSPRVGRNGAGADTRTGPAPCLLTPAAPAYTDRAPDRRSA